MDNGFNHGFITLEDPKKKLAKDMAKKQNQTKGRGGIASSLISEISGAGAAGIGGAIGTALLPGVGTAIGVGIGGLVGGIGGRIAENEVRDSRVGLGDAVKEGATNAILGGAAKGYQAYKGAKAVKGLSSIAKVADGPSTTITKSAKGIPVKYVPTSSSAKGQLDVSRNQLINPTVGQLDDAYHGLVQGGYKVSGKVADSTPTYVGNKAGRKLTSATPGFYGPKGQPIVSMTGRKTSIPFGETVTGSPETLLAKSQPVTTEVIPGISGDASSAIQAPKRLGLLESVGQSLKRGASGYGTGAKVSGQEQLTSSGSDAVDATLKTLKIPATAPETQARMLDNHLNNIGSVLSKRYAQANAPVSTQEINGLGSNILGKVANTGGLSEGARKFALDEAEKLAKVGTDVNKVWEYSKELARNSTNFGANADAKLVDKEAAARIILDETRGFLNGKVPGAADANNLYHNAKQAEGFILDASRDKGGGLIQRLASSGPVKTAEAKAGGLLESVGKYSAGTGGNASQFTNQLKVQAPGSLSRGFIGLNNPSDAQTAQAPQDLMSQPQEGQSVTGDLLGQTNQGGDVTAQLLGQPQQDQSAGGPSLSSLQQAIQQDIQTTGGKNISDLMQLGQLYGIVDQQGNPVQKTQGGLGANVGKVAAKDYANAQAGLQGVQNIAQLLGSDPSLLAKSAVPGGSLPIIGGYLRNQAGTGQLDAYAYDAADKYLKLTTGATATDAEIKNTATKLMPRAGDSPATVQSKLKQMADYYSIYLQGAQ